MNLFSSSFKELYRQIHSEIFVTFNGFCPLNKKNNKKKQQKKQTHPPVPNGQYQNGWNTNQNFLHCVSSFEGTFYKNL